MKPRFATLERSPLFKFSSGLLLALGIAACGQEATVKDDAIVQESTPAMISSGTYQIVSRSSGKALSVDGSSTVDGAGVVQTGYTGNSSQQWKVTSEAGSAFKIQNLKSAKFLDIDVSVSGGLNDGAKVQQWSEGASQINQRWEFSDAGAGWLKISSKLSAKALDVAAVSNAENGKVHQWTYYGNANQQWKLIPVSTPPTPPPVTPPPVSPPPTPPPSVTADFYVAPSGDDANAGSDAKPFRTIQRAVGAVKAGQTVLVRGGVYYERRISFAGAGTPAAPITFKAAPGERVVIDHGLRVPSWNLESGSVYKGAPEYVAGAPKDRTLAVVVAGRPLEQVTGALKEGTWSLDGSTGLVRVWAFGGASPATQETVVLNSSDEFGLRTGIYIGGDGKAVGHVVFDGFNHRGAETAIWATNFGRGGVQNEGLTLKNCEIAFNWQYALRLDGWKGALMDNCDVYGNGLVHYPVSKEVTWPHSIIGWDGDDVTVTGSKVHDNFGEGIGPFSGCSNWKIVGNEVYDNHSVNIYIDTSDGDMLVDRNLVYNTGKNGRGYKISPDNIRVANEDADLYKTDPTPNIYNVTITNNIVLGVGPGITSFRYQGGSSYLQNSVIANNTVLAVAGYGGWDTDAIYVNPGENVTVANNIVYGGRITIGDAIGAGVNLKNNWVADASKLNASAQNVTVTGTRFGDPQFALGTGFTSEAYRLRSGSPARDAGVSLTAVLTDFAGLTRPQGSAFDIGAFEER